MGKKTPNWFISSSETAWNDISNSIEAAQKNEEEMKWNEDENKKKIK